MGKQTKKRNKNIRESGFCKPGWGNIHKNVWIYYSKPFLKTTLLNKSKQNNLSPAIFFLDNWDLQPKYTDADQIHPGAFLDAHRGWQAAFSSDMLNSDRWFSSHVCQNIAWRSLSMRLSRTCTKLLCIHLHSVQPSRHQLRWIWTITLRQGGSLLSFVAKQ